MIVKMILKTKARGAGVISVNPEATIAQAARLLAEHRIGALVVVDAQGGVSGILSERDIVRGMAADCDGCIRASVRSLMTRDVLTCRQDDRVEDLMKVMTQRRVRHLPVLDDDGHLMGMVTIGDLVKSRLDEADLEVDNLRHYVVAAR